MMTWFSRVLSPPGVAATAAASMVYVDAPVCVWIRERPSSSCCAVTTISGKFVASVASATAATLANMQKTGTATFDAASRRDTLDIRMTPQKLNEHGPPPTFRPVRFVRQRFQLAEGGPRLRG